MTKSIGMNSLCADCGFRCGSFLYFQVMAATEKTKLLNEIEAKIQSLNLLLSTIKADRSRKPETLEDYRQQYHAMLSPNLKKRK